MDLAHKITIDATDTLELVQVSGSVLRADQASERLKNLLGLSSPAGIPGLLARERNSLIGKNKELWTVKHKYQKYGICKHHGQKRIGLFELENDGFSKIYYRFLDSVCMCH